jgi:hypothetical protein
MKRLMVKRTHSVAPVAGSSRALRPELRFRGMAPTEALLPVAREQDELFRSVLAVDHAASQVSVERREHDAGVRFQVLVRAFVRGSERCGCVEHADAQHAMRESYTALLRAVIHETVCPCAQAA